MAGSANQDDDEITGINVTPLVDVMLVLLIIFMVTANYINQQSIKVELPEASTGESQSEAQELNFVLDKNANLFLNGEAVNIEGIDQQILDIKAKAKNEHLQALISADRETSHGAVIRLIDAVRKNGIHEFALNVDLPEKKAN